MQDIICLTTTKLASISEKSPDAITLVGSSESNRLTDSIVETREVSAWLWWDLAHGTSVAMLTCTTEGGATENGTSTVVSAGVGVAGTTGVIGGPPGVNRGSDGGIKNSCMTRKNIKRVQVMSVISL